MKGYITKSRPVLLLVLITLTVIHAYANPSKKISKPDNNKILAYQVDRAKLSFYTQIIVQPDFEEDYFSLPDYDQDGTPDKYDKCPSTPGVPERQGCPDIDITKLITYAHPKIAIPDSDFEASVKAFANLQFVNERLTNESAEALNVFIKVLKRQSNWRVSLSSYADLGKDVDNVQVSKNRLEQLHQYMMKNGISRKRIQCLAFGDTIPVVDLPLNRFEIEIRY